MRMRLAGRVPWDLAWVGPIPRPSRELFPLARVTTLQRVNDADGLLAYFGRTAERCRLVGVDGPELGAVDPLQRTRARACMARLAELVRGVELELRWDPLQPSQDRYGRHLVYVFAGVDRLDVCRLLIEEGHARAWRAGKYVRRAEFCRVELEVRKSVDGRGDPRGTGLHRNYTEKTRSKSRDVLTSAQDQERKITEGAEGAEGIAQAPAAHEKLSSASDAQGAAADKPASPPS